MAETWVDMRPLHEPLSRQDDYCVARQADMIDKRSIADLVAAFNGDGCSICRLVDDQIQRLIATLERECVMDPESRAELRAAGGFCAVHAGMWQRSASVLATAHLYGDLMQRVLEELEELKPPRSGTFSRRRASAGRSRLLEPEAPCRLCAGASQTAVHFARVFGQAIDDEPIRSAYRSGTLCLPHGQLVLEHTLTVDAYHAVRDHLAAQAAETLADLREIVRKHDYRFQGESSGAEAGAGKRAVRLVNGERYARMGQ